MVIRTYARAHEEEATIDAAQLQKHAFSHIYLTPWVTLKQALHSRQGYPPPLSCSLLPYTIMEEIGSIQRWGLGDATAVKRRVVYPPLNAIKT